MPSPRTPSPRTPSGRIPTEALFVRIPAEHARRLDRAAFELRVPKQSLVSGLVDRYVDPDSPRSLAALHRLGFPGARRAQDAAIEPRPEVGGEPRPEIDTRQGTRRVTVETLDGGELTVGHHSFRPREPEVLTSEEAAELLQVDAEVVLDLARAGVLPGRELGGQWRFARVALLRWLGEGGSGAPATSASEPAAGSETPAPTDKG